MKILCTQNFCNEYKKLCSHKTHRDLPALIKKTFQNKTREELEAGSRIFSIPNQPYIKKRLGGSGGYRIDYQLVIKEDETILIFVYPKTGKDSKIDLSTAERKELLINLLEERKNNSLLEIDFSSEDIFKQTSPKKLP